MSRSKTKVGPIISTYKVHISLFWPFFQLEVLTPNHNAQESTGYSTVTIMTWIYP